MNNRSQGPAGSNNEDSQSITLWLACVTAILAAVIGGIASLFLSTVAATMIGLIPIVAFGAWRLVIFLHQENEAGLNAFDRVSIFMGGLSQESEGFNSGPFVRLGLATVVTLVLIAGVVVVMKSSGKGGGTNAADPGTPNQAAGAPGSKAPEATTPEIRHGDGPYDVQVSRLATLAWPVNGVLSAYFERDDPTGITIDLPRSADTPVLASARGVIQSAGGDTCCGYGYNIVVQHEDEWSSLYANLSEVLVAAGQHVEKGDIIGYGGDTGSASRKQLHYELRRAGQPVNPLLYLPSTQSGVTVKASEQVACPATGILIDPNSTVSLAFVGQSLYQYRIESVGDVTYTDPAAPQLVVRQVGPLSLTVAVPAATAPTTTGMDYVMNLVLAKDTDHMAIECHMRLKTAASVPFEPTSTQVQSSPTPTSRDGSQGSDASINQTPTPDDGSSGPSGSIDGSGTPRPSGTATPVPALNRIQPSPTPSRGPTATPRPGSKPPAGKPTPTHFPKLPGE